MKQIGGRIRIFLAVALFGFLAPGVAFAISISGVNPGSAAQGSSVTVNINGMFDPAATTATTVVAFDVNITTAAPLIISVSQNVVVASFTTLSNAPLGARTISVVQGPVSASLGNAFTVTAGTSGGSGGTDAFREVQPLPGGLQGVSGLFDFFTKAANWIFTIFIIVSVLFIILAAFQFVTSGGDAAKVSEARQKLIWAIVGIAIAVMSRGLPAVIRNMLNP